MVLGLAQLDGELAPVVQRELAFLEVLAFSRIKRGVAFLFLQEPVWFAVLPDFVDNEQRAGNHVSPPDVGLTMHPVLAEKNA